MMDCFLLRVLLLHVLCFIHDSQQLNLSSVSLTEGYLLMWTLIYLFKPSCHVRVWNPIYEFCNDTVSDLCGLSSLVLLLPAYRMNLFPASVTCVCVCIFSPVCVLLCFFKKVIWKCSHRCSRTLTFNCTFNSLSSQRVTWVKLLCVYVCVCLPQVLQLCVESGLFPQVSH